MKHSIALAGLLVASAFVADNVYKSSLTYKVWGEYKKIEYVTRTEGDLFFRSHLIVKVAPITLTFHDILECDYGEGVFAFYSNFGPTSRTYAEPQDNRKAGKPWRFGGKAPKSGLCRMVSSITYNKMSRLGPFNIDNKKVQVIVSEPFRF